jgi:hypothetical protein
VLYKSFTNKGLGDYIMSLPAKSKAEVRLHHIYKSKSFITWFKAMYSSFIGNGEDSVRLQILSDLFVDSLENISYLDIDIENKQVTYLKHTDRSKYGSSNERYSDPKNLRISTKIGRLVRRLSSSKPDSAFLSDREIELINNHFLTYCAEHSFNNNPLIVWTPDKVPYAYLEDNYSKMAGTLGSSCMRYSNGIEKMDFYAKNNVGVVVLLPQKTNKNSPKIRARALLWYDIKIKDHNGTHTLLDKVYTSDDRVLPLFEVFAKGHGAYQKNMQGGYNYKLNGKSLAPDPLFIKKLSYLQWKLPYLDTMKYLYPKKMVLTNDPRYAVSKTMITLASTVGEFPQLDPNLVKELFTGSWVSKDRGKYIKRKGYSGWVALDNIIIISTKEYSKFDPKLIESHSLNGLVYVFKDESTFSELMGKQILKRDSVPVYTLIEEGDKEFSITKNGTILPQSVKGTKLLWTGNYVISSNISTKYNNGRVYLTKLLKNKSKTHTRQYYFGESYKTPTAYDRWYSDMPLEEIPHPNHITDLSMPKFEDYTVQYKTKKGDTINMKVKAEINQPSLKIREENKDHAEGLTDKYWFFPVNPCKTIEDWNERWKK